MRWELSGVRQRKRSSSALNALLYFTLTNVNTSKNIRTFCNTLQYVYCTNEFSELL